MFRSRKRKFDVEIKNSLNFSVCTDTGSPVRFPLLPGNTGCQPVRFYKTNVFVPEFSLTKLNIENSATYL